MQNQTVSIDKELQRQAKAYITNKILSPKAYIETFGCQGNVSDSQLISSVLTAIGYTIITNLAEADLVLFNTCAVREHAEQKVFGNVGELKHLKARNPKAIIVLCGCMVQQSEIADKIKRSYPFVDIVFGTNLIHKLPIYILEKMASGGSITDISGDDAMVEDFSVDLSGAFKGNLPIMYGCNNYCTYCIVPHVRGRERSRDIGKILDDANAMIAAGYKEITLLGQNVNSYGRSEQRDVSFVDVLREICKIKGDYILRFMTSHPKDCSNELIDFIASEPKMAKHLHLPVQSGSDRILLEMNRQYTTEHYLGIINYAKSIIPEMVFSSDIIVGFPMETRSDFEATLNLINKVEFKHLYTFIYSKRTGTKAAGMDDETSDSEKSLRLREVLAVQETISTKLSTEMFGKTFRILVDQKGRNEGCVLGKTEGSVTVECEGDDSLIGNFVNVKIISGSAWWLKGQVVK